MNGEKSLAKNYLFNLIKTLCNVAFPIITFTYTSRILGADGLGKINFSKSFISYFSMVAMLGINQYGTREAAKVRDNKTKLTKFVHEILIVNFITTTFAYLLLYFSILFVNKLQDYTILLWINSFSIVMMGMGMEWLYQALEEYGYIAKRAITFQIISIILMFVFVRNKNDVVIYAFINVISSSGSYVLNFFNVRNYIDIKPLWNYNLKKHISPMLWLFAMAVSVELYTVLDSTMLGFICGDTSVGLYTAAIKVNKMIIGLITALGTVLIPRLSYYVGLGEYEKLQKLVDKGYNYIFLLSIPSFIGLFVLSNDIIMLFSGSEYKSACLTMKILTPIVVVIPFSTMTNNQTFMPLNKEKLILISTCIGAVTNFICNIILIPKFAENGAAIGTVIAELAVASVCLLNATKLLNMRSIFKNFYQYWIAALPTVFISYIVKQMKLNYIVEVGIVMVISGGLYAGILYLLKNDYFILVLKIISTKICKKKSFQD